MVEFLKTPDQRCIGNSAFTRVDAFCALHRVRGTQLQS
jgi:hypothetical protein